MAPLSGCAMAHQRLSGEFRDRLAEVCLSNDPFREQSDRVGVFLLPEGIAPFRPGQSGPRGAAANVDFVFTPLRPGRRERCPDRGANLVILISGEEPASHLPWCPAPGGLTLCARGGTSMSPACAVFGRVLAIARVP